MSKTIGIIIGSLRKNSFSQSIANFVKENAPDGLDFKIIEIGDLAIYNQDYDADNEPTNYSTFRNAIKAVDGVLFITPEHNRSIPAALKNALDIGSRPYGANVWSGKPGAIISQSPGGIGGFGANHHLRQILTFLNIPTLAQPEAYIGAFHTLIDENGIINNDGTRDFISAFLSAYADWVSKNS